jgi:hypothetical protein
MLAKQVKAIMLEVDENQDGVIDFQEFCHMMCAAAPSAGPAGPIAIAGKALPRAKTARKGQLLPEDAPDDSSLLQRVSAQKESGRGEKRGLFHRAKTMSNGQLSRAKTARKGHLDVAGLIASSQGNLHVMSK